MPDTGDDTQMATAYPPESLYQKWKTEAKDRDMNVSPFIIAMVEAGRKQIHIDDVANESHRQLQKRNTELQNELHHQRERNQKLERQLQQTTQTEIVDFVEKHPGATTPEIIQHVANTVPSRVASRLDLLEGDALAHREDGYYPLTDDHEGGTDEPSAQSVEGE